MTSPPPTLSGINRRKLLKATSVAAIGGVAFTGQAAATAPSEIRFCGCSQVCIDIPPNEPYRILYATDEDGDFSCSLEPTTDEDPLFDADCYTAGEDEKIIGVLDGVRNLYPNPNTCAQKALADIDPNECAGCNDDYCDPVVTYDQIGKHEYIASNGVTVRTRLCKPPTKWRDDPNGPADRGNSGQRGR